ncbi:MAG: hypothetical protein Q9201_006807 [Fulgogasparrea decipioides]
MAPGPCSTWDGRLDEHDLVEVLDLTGLLPKEPLCILEGRGRDWNIYGETIDAARFPAERAHCFVSAGDEDFPSLEELLGNATEKNPIHTTMSVHNHVMVTTPSIRINVRKLVDKSPRPSTMLRAELTLAAPPATLKLANGSPLSGTSDCSQHTSYQRYEPNPPSTALSQIHNVTEKGLRGTQSSQLAVGTNKTERIDEEREADKQSEKPKKVGKEGIVMGRLTKKRGRPITGTQPSLERRIQRLRLSSPLSASSSSSSHSSSEDETETDIEPDGSNPVPAKQDCASSLRTVSSKLVYRASEQRPPSRTASSSHPQSRNTTFGEQGWEIIKIVSKRRVGKGFEYKVRWTDTWLPKSALGKAQRLLQEFEARSQPQRGRRLSRPAYIRNG